MAGAQQLILPAPAKLNLSLRVRGRRADGMHYLGGVMILLDFCDVVTLTARADGRIERAWQCDGITDDNDLAARAARQLQKESGCEMGATIAVQKRIPIGGGLGGASSNAATTLLGLNKLWNLEFSAQKLLHIARFLGADVPFFLHGLPAEVSGIGDVFEDAKTHINNYLLVFPPESALTAAVFAEYDRLQEASNESIIPPSLAASDNDLTAAAVKLHPSIAQAAVFLREAAGEARLSGSGSTLFAAFASAACARQAQAALPAQTRSVVARGLSRHPLQEKTNWGVAKW